MKKSILILFLAILSACNGVNTNKGQNTDPINKEKKDTAENTATKNSKQIDTSLLYGVWSIVGETNATFVMDKSTIFYPDNSAKYNYVIAGDSVKIYYEAPEKFCVKFSGKDTMTLTGEDGPAKYYRFKK